MEKYFYLESGQCTWEMYISDLTKTQKAYIRRYFKVYPEPMELDKKAYKYVICKNFTWEECDEGWGTVKYYGNELEYIKNYLLGQVFEEVTYSDE